MVDIDPSNTTDALEHLLSTERDRLVRFCARRTDDRDGAEDLAQETLIEAWRHRSTLRTWAARRAWLYGIARNVCRRAGRRHAQAVTSTQPLCAADSSVSRAAPRSDAAHAVFERAERATLLERALGHLPAPTRAALVARYLLDLPQAEIAARLRISEGAVEARLQRGKHALRRVLATDLQGEAVAVGILEDAAAPWQPTRIWCPFCGLRRLDAQVDHTTSDATFRCSACASNVQRPIVHTRGAQVLGGVSSYKAVLSRQIAWLHGFYTSALRHGQVACHCCGARSRVERRLPDDVPSWMAGNGGLHVTCPTCGTVDVASLSYLVLDLPQTQAFWRAHPRMRVLPDRTICFAAQDALLTSYESVDGTARLDAISDPVTLALLAVHRT